MDGLWTIVDSLSLKNKKWLAGKLQRSLTDAVAPKEKEILSGIKQSMKQAKAGETLPLDTLWDQL